MSQSTHRSGFVNILGKPNAGKSTLMNALVGERMSIITSKPQTTRHRILGILNDEHFQIVFSDTPGLITEPQYQMQSIMNQSAESTLEDADVLLVVTTPEDNWGEDGLLIEKLKQQTVPLFLVLNKLDAFSSEEIDAHAAWWQERLSFSEVVRISALHQLHTQQLLQHIVEHLPESPPYYPKDQLTDKPERFFVSEMIREQILEQYHQEIPYASEVIVQHFQVGKTKSGEDITRIGATIFVMRETQKAIILGKGGSAIKKLGAAARKSMEYFLDTKVYLELHVKVRKDWRDDERQLKHFGYQ